MLRRVAPAALRSVLRKTACGGSLAGCGGQGRHTADKARPQSADTLHGHTLCLYACVELHLGARELSPSCESSRRGLKDLLDECIQMHPAPCLVQRGTTALMCAAATGWTALLRMLLGKGADARKRSKVCIGVGPSCRHHLSLCSGRELERNLCVVSAGSLRPTSRRPSLRCRTAAVRCLPRRSTATPSACPRCSRPPAT